MTTTQTADVGRDGASRSGVELLLNTFSARIDRTTAGDGGQRLKLYCTCKLGKTAFETEVSRKSAMPVWTGFEERVFVDANDAADTRLVLEVFHRGRRAHDDEFVGAAVVQLEELLEDMPSGKLHTAPLRLAGGGSPVGFVSFRSQKQRTLIHHGNATTAATAQLAARPLAQQTRTPEKRAVVVGVNAYAEPYQLRGAVADAETVTAWLTTLLGFETTHIMRLIDEQATGAAIENALTEVVRDAVPGDTIWFSFSGHGTLLAQGTGEVARSETALCPVDLDWNNPFTSRRLHHILTPAVAAGASVWLFMDCCHSGTMGTKAIASQQQQQQQQQQFRVRFIPAPEEFAPLPNTARWSLSSYARIAEGKRKIASSLSRDQVPSSQQQTPPIILLSACQDEQTAADIFATDGSPHGAFTYSWDKALAKLGVTTNGELLLETKQYLRTIGEYITQTPGLVPLSASSIKFVSSNGPEKTSVVETGTVPVAKVVLSRDLQPAITVVAGSGGCILRFWKDDPTTVGLPIRDQWMHHSVGTGPSDAQITVTLPEDCSRSTELVPSQSGDFLPTTDDELEPVHCYAVVRNVVDMYERYLRSSEIHDNPQWELSWAFGEKIPISVHPRAGFDANAYYSRQERALKFFFFDSDDGTHRTYTSRSFDVVAHETGHAILDSLQPEWMDLQDGWAGALHESFGDMTAIVAHLAQLDVCEALVTLTRGNLRDDNALCLIAPQFGRELLGKASLRNANNDFGMADVGSRIEREVHSLSQIFTGAFYTTLAGVFTDLQNPRLFDTSETLFRIGKKARLLLMYAFVHVSPNTPTFGAVAEKMLEVAKNKRGLGDVWVKHLLKQYGSRGIVDAAKGTAIPPPSLDPYTMLNASCGTIRHRLSSSRPFVTRTDVPAATSAKPVEDVRRGCTTS